MKPNSAAEDDDVLGKPADVHHAQRHGVEERRHEVAIGDGVHAVGDDAREPQARGQRVHVDAVGIAGDRARAQRQRVGFARHRGDALGVAAERGRVRQEPVRGEHGLRAPQMGVGRHQRVAGLLGLRDQRRDDAHDQAIDRDQPAPQVEPQIDADLLVGQAAVNTSPGPPAPNGAMILIGRVGYSCAAAGTASVARAASARMASGNRDIRVAPGSQQMEAV
jgi:hypothetical protein